jgi:hypothetical protein
MIRRALLILFLVLPAGCALKAQDDCTCDLRSGRPYLQLPVPHALYRAIGNYTAALQSENLGLVESGIFFAVQLRARYPREDVSCLVRALTRLTTWGATTAIRYKAMLALFACENPSLIPGEEASWKSTDEFFVLLARRMEMSLLVDGGS